MREAEPAIPAARNRPGYDLIYWSLIRTALWNHFDRVRVQIIGRLPCREDGPLICYLNHPGWWDAYMAALVDRKLLRLRFESYGMMEEPQLRAYRFFRWAGAFSVDRHNPREAARSVAYISRLLREQSGRALYIFPQGTITPNDQRPLVLFSGLAHIVRRSGGAMLCPVALRYEFRGEQLPEAFIRFGPVHRVAAPVDVQALTAEATQRLTESADALRAAVVADDMSNFRVLLRGRPGINRVFDLVQRLWSGLRS
jgi:1-acyl-sn-glycerol-3-phosphate acyltransferase